MQYASYDSIAALVRGKTTDDPVFCFHPPALRAVAAHFLRGFPGTVQYAVKANPHPIVLQSLYDGGIRHFDTASLAEIALIRELFPDAGSSYNHPVKPRAAIEEAYTRWGIRDYVIDHAAELDKLLAVAGTDIVVQVRVAAPNPHATISFNSKFGATPADTVALLKAVRARGARAAICTHLGYQTIDPLAFASGIRVIAQVVSEAGFDPEYVNLGGGFPSVLMPAGRTLDDFFTTIRTTVAAEPRLAHLPLRCEPGSALAHPGGSALAQVHLVKEDSIYINDGVYGALAELPYTKKQPPSHVYAPDGSLRLGAGRSYTVFGPTCDSVDTMPVRFELPQDIREGDWLHLGVLGAYSHTLITDFNGLGRHEVARIDDAA